MIRVQENDIVEVNGTNVINAAVSPITKRTIAMFAFDQGADGVSDLSAPIPIFFALPFLSAVDMFIPGASPPTGTVSVTLRSRGEGPLQQGEVPELRLHGRHRQRAVRRLRALSGPVRAGLVLALALIGLALAPSASPAKDPQPLLQNPWSSDG